MVTHLPPEPVYVLWLSGSATQACAGRDRRVRRAGGGVTLGAICAVIAAVMAGLAALLNGVLILWLLLGVLS